MTVEEEVVILREALTRMQRESNVAIERHRRLKREHEWAMRDNHLKNLELDALYHVWCDGGCKGGALRFTGGHRGPITEEIVKMAEENTRRLRRWWDNQRLASKGARHEALSKLISNWRWAEKLTAREAAAMIGLSPSTYSRLERGYSVDGSTLAIVLAWLLQPRDGADAPIAAPACRES